MAHKLKSNKIHTNSKNKQNKPRKYNAARAAIEYNDISQVSSYGNRKPEFINDYGRQNVADFMVDAENSLDEDGIYEYSNDLVIDHNKDSENTSIMDTNYSKKQYRRKVYPIENRCYVCPKDFLQQKDLVRHAQQLHPNDKAFKCRHCPTLFSKLKSLSTHFKRCHANLAKTISCDYCYKSFFAQFQLERHRRTHAEYYNRLNFMRTEDEDAGNSSANMVGADDGIYENRKGKIYPIQKKCAVCNMKFSLQKTLVQHCQQAHVNDKAFKCLYCPTVFSKLKSVTTHYKRTHSKSTKTIFCEYCNMSFFTKFLLERHLRSHTEKRPFHCQLCDKSYKYKRNLDVHMRTHSKNAKTSSNNAKDKEFPDNYCENDEEEEEIILTDDEEHNENEEDEEENEYYDNPNQFAEDEYYENDDEEDEETRVTGDEYYENQHEQEGSNFNKALQNQHKNTAENHLRNRLKNNITPAEIITINDDDDYNTTEKEPDNSSNIYKNTYFIIDEFNTDTEQDDQYTAAADYPNGTDEDEEDYTTRDIVSVSVDTDQNECGVCSKVFKCQQSVARHLHRHHPEIEFFKCPYCDDNFYSLDSLAEHIKLKKHPQKQNVCKYCLKSFDRRTDLNRHIRIHTDERPYSCNQCDTAFKQINHLKRHKESMHSSSSLFVQPPQKMNCEFCAKSFSDADMLKRHLMSTHDTNRTSFACTMCNKMFKKRYDWQRHEQTHSSRMDLICDYCLKPFNSNEALNRHLKTTHTGEFKFLCTVCKKTFRRKSHLINHHKSHKN